MDAFFIVILIGSIFSVISAIFYFVNSFRSVKFKPEINIIQQNTKDVTIVIPVFNEDVNLFAKVLESSTRQGSDVIVVGDGCNAPYAEIAKKYSARFLSTPTRGGKRKALNLAMNYVETRFVMFVDSDTIIPYGAVVDLLSSFTDKIGGVGANLKIMEDGRPLSYASEFVERSREVILKAMNKSGNVMILDGGCAVYRTDLVKPFILSTQFSDYKVFGRKSVVGDDRQLTSYIIKSGYKAVKNYSVQVQTPSQKTLKSYYRQQVRWARNGWYYFFKDLFGGTSRKAGPFYTFEMLYVYLLPLIFLGLGASEFYLFLFAHHFSYARFTFEHAFEFFLVQVFTFRFIRITRLASTLVNFFGISVFGIAISNNMSRNKLKTFAFGAIGLLIMFVASIHGLLTIWKQGSWLTR